jgi:hypothetical protein
MPDRVGFTNRVRAGIVACIGALACTAPTNAASSVPYWGQVQSHLEVLDGTPLVAANWHGRYRPYVLARDAFVPLLQSDVAGIADVDLVSPLAVSANEVLLLGSASGRPEYDLFLYDRPSAALTNLTATPTVDDGNPCVNETTRLLAFRTGSGEQIARLRHGLVPLSHPRLPAFERCTWVDATTLIGIERVGLEYRLHRCTVADDAVACERRPGLDDVENVTALPRPFPLVTIVARRRGELFRRPFMLPSPFSALTPAALGFMPEGDVLDLDGDAMRVGFHGRYTSSLVPDSAATVYTTRRIGNATFAIVATEHMTRTLARAERGAWRLIRDSSVVMPEHLARPIEVWMRSPAGEVYQAFYFGPTQPERVIVWWHGGPAESVSPRFNPYFHRLNQLGFAVLAVNYPGSTGRGAAFEARFEPRALGDCVRATWAYLRENDVRDVVSWSVSSGITVQAAVLAQRVPVSAIVDQAAWGRSTVRQEAARRGIPVFAIRGRHDPYGPTDSVDYWYAGGHDITMAQDFVGLFDAAAPFLAAVRPVSWDDGNDTSPEIVLEVTAADPDASIGFELATHLRRVCFANRDLVVSPTGVPALGSRDRAREHLTAWLARHPATPAVRIGVRGGVTMHGAPAPSRLITMNPIDLVDATEKDRLRTRIVAPDGWVVHPRLQAAAEAQCPALLAHAERHRVTVGAQPAR